MLGWSNYLNTNINPCSQILLFRLMHSQYPITMIWGTAKVAAMEEIEEMKTLVFISFF